MTPPSTTKPSTSQHAIELPPKPAGHQQLNAKQAEALTVPVTQPLQVFAGAGTGKTTLMAYRYVNALYHCAKRADDNESSQSPLEKVLAVTFTVKAADEMVTRVGKVLDQYQQHHPEDPTWQTLHQEFMANSHTAWIHNFHNLGQRLLREHGLLHGWGKHLRVINSAEQAELWQTLQTDIANNQADDLQAALTYGQCSLQASDFTAQALGNLPLANPHQTLRQVFDELPSLVEQLKTAGISPKEFLQQTPQQTAAFTQHLINTPQHGLGYQLPESNEELCQWWGKHFKPYATPSWPFEGTTEDQAAFLEEKLAKRKTPFKPTDKPLESFFKKQCDWLNNTVGLTVNSQVAYPYPRFNRSNCIEGLSQPVLAKALNTIDADEQRLINVIGGLYALYQYRLFLQNQCDTNDLILQPLQLLNKQPQLANRLHQQFTSRIVDECQDTNGSQLKLIHQLTPVKNSGLMVVGDIKQAIYGFRYAQPENISAMLAPIQAAGQDKITTIELTENYRSSPPIIALANGVARQLNLPNNPDLTASGKEKSITTPVKHITITPSEKTGDDGKPIKTTQAEILAKETSLIVDEVIVQREAGRKPNDIAILVNSHHKAADIATKLAERGIASQRDKRPLLTEPCMSLWLYLIRWLANPADDEAIIGLLQTRLTDGGLMLLSEGRYQLNQQAQGKSDTNNTKKIGLDGTLAALSNTAFIPQLELSRRTACLSLHQSIHQCRKALGYQQWVQQVNALALELDLWQSDGQLPLPIEQLSQWVEHEQQKLPYKYYRLRQWVQTLQHYRQTGDGPAAPMNPADAGVHILTTHAAKGLEFPVVILAQAFKPSRRPSSKLIDVEPRFGEMDNPTNPQFGLYLRQHPICFSKGTLATLKHTVVNHIWRYPRQDAEQQRLFYVAVTRAKEELIIVRGPNSSDWSNPTALLTPTEQSTYLITTNHTL